MTCWPDHGDRIIESHITRLQLKYPISPIYYRQALRTFQMAAIEDGETGRRALERWLHERDRVWARSTVLQRAGIVNRFLDFLVDEQKIASNPITDLRTEYNARSGTAIIEALLAPEPEQALDAARHPLPFGSVLGDLMCEHIERMQARGYRYETATVICRRFDRFLQSRPDLVGLPMESMLQHWRAARTSANHAAECERLARILDRARCHGDPSRVPRRPDPRPVKQVAQQWRRPHIYSPDEIVRLLETARSYPSPHAPARPINLYTMLVLAYCAGLRLGELARLTLADVDLKVGTITIRETKFFKSRTLPLSDSAVVALETLIKERRKARIPDGPDASLFWHDQGDRSYTRAAIAANLVGVLRTAGIKPAKGKVGPRIHDLRHTFVVHRILEWYRKGINPQDRLSFLATYLGHRDINSTLVYITVTKELLQEASERFRSFGATCLIPPVEARS